MANATYIRTADTGLLARVEMLLQSGAQALRRYRIQSRTQAELAALSDRELADLGIARVDIRRVARTAATDF